MDELFDNPNNWTNDYGKAGLARRIWDAPDTNLGNKDSLKLYQGPEWDDNKGYFGNLLAGNRGAMNAAQVGMGVGQLGLGLASYLQQSDFMKKQGKLLDQQLASNRYEMDRRQGFSRDIGDPNGAFATSYNAVRNA